MSVATRGKKRNTFSSGAYLATLMAELDRAQISRRIKAARIEAGFRSQKELGDLLHVHWRTVQDWESDKSSNVPFDRMEEIGRATEKSKYWLLHGREEADLDRDSVNVGEILLLLRSLEEKVDLLARADAVKAAFASLEARIAELSPRRRGQTRQQGKDPAARQ